MDSRMDLSALERSRLLSTLPSSALGHLGLSALAVSEQSHSSALNRLSAASAAAAAAAAGASPPDLARAGSPSGGLSQYPGPGRYMSSSALHSPGASYAMMAGYFGSGGPVPDSFKALMPEFQQYWGTSQEGLTLNDWKSRQENPQKLTQLSPRSHPRHLVGKGTAQRHHQRHYQRQPAYARQLLANMYYPYLPYLPATESLSLFAQNSATAAQVQAAAQAQAHAAHHRIYDLHKEALFGPGAIPGYYPQSLLLTAQSPSQVEATNLSVSSSSKSKQKDDKDKHKQLESESAKVVSDSAKTADNKIHVPDNERAYTSDGSERTRGINVKKSADDYIKCRSGDGIKRSSSSNATQSSYSVSKAEHERKRSKLEAVLRQTKETSDDPCSSKPRTCRGEIPQTDKKRSDKLNSPVAYGDYFVPIPAFSPSRTTAFHSPTRNERVISPDRRSSKAHSPVRSQKTSSPLHVTDISQPVQDKPENLCVKDRKSNVKELSKSDKHRNVLSNVDNVVVKTQSIVTGTTVIVTSTLNVITSDMSPPIQNRKLLKETESSPRHMSPSSSSTSSNTTSTTYSLPYYHNLYSRSQSNPQDGKKVHAVTYVPEIGTVSSPFVCSPPISDTKSITKDENGSESPKQHSDNVKSVSALPLDKTDSNKVSRVLKSSPDIANNETVTLSDSNTDYTERNDERDSDSNEESNKTKSTESVAKQKVLPISKTNIESCKIQETICFKESGSELLKRMKSTSPSVSSTSKRTVDVPKDKNAVSNATVSGSTKNGDVILVEESKNETSECDSIATNKSSAINSKTVISSKISEIPCDMNHNSKSAKNPILKQSDVRTLQKPAQCEVLNVQDQHKNVSSTATNKKDSRKPTDETDKSKSTPTDSEEKTVRSEIETDSQKGEKETDSQKGEKADSGKGSCKEEKVVKSKESDKGPPKEKRDHSSVSGSSIPVGIAVARQRNIAPKTDKDLPKSSEDVRGKMTAAAEIKPVRPLKIIRPSSKGKTHGATEFRNELPANLIVTGGNNNSGLFWSNDQTSRQLAAQYLQPNNQLNTSTWYGQQNHITFPHNSQTTPTSESSQLPFSVPPGFELAQNSLTGGILLIPSATDVYDSSRIFSGFQVGSQNTPSFGHSMLATPQTQSAAATFIGQSSLEGPAHYHSSFNSEVLPRPETSVKEEKREINTQHSADSIITSAVSLTTGQDNGAVSMIVHQDIDKDKIMTVPPPSFVTDLSLTAGQQCAYAFHPPAMPYLFNPSMMPVHNIPEPASDVNHSKQEHTSVQSRGTSPMLPATDSSNEENEECGSQPEEKVVNHDEKTDITDNDTAREAKLGADLREELSSSDPITEIDAHVETQTEDVKPDVTVKAESVRIGEKSTSDCDKTFCDESVENKEALPTKTFESENIQSSEIEQTVSENSDNKTDQPDLIDTPKSAKEIDNSSAKENKLKILRPSRPDRNIFNDLTEYNPFTDPQILQAADGLELLSALAEKSSLCSNVHPTETKLCEEPKADTLTEDVYTFKEDKISTSKSLSKKTETEKETIVLSPKETKKPAKSRIKCGYAFKPTKTPETAHTSPVRMTTFCGITIPEDDDVIDSIEMEMKMRLVELQKRYREKQKELTRLKPRKEKEKGKDDEKEKETVSETEKKFDPKRGRGRPKKRKHETEENDTINSGAQSPKTKSVKSEAAQVNKTGQNGRHSKSHSSQHTNATHGNQSSGSHNNSTNGTHGSSKKKKLAEMLVDRVFRKAGSSFKIPLSKKISLIAPARIELPGTACNSTEKSEPRHAKKSLDFRRLIKGSRLSQLNGKDRCFDGGLWRRKEEKRTHSQSSSKEEKPKKPKKHEVESGLGLLAEYATKYREEKDKEKEKEKEKYKDKEREKEKYKEKEKEKDKNKDKEKIEKTKKKRKNEDETNSSSPDSPNKKRKPGRPKKCDLIRPGVTETIVAKQSKHMDFFRWQKDEKPERKISLEGKTPLKPLYLDEWNVRRSERIFLSDTSPQTSPNAVSPGVKQKPGDEKDKATEVKGKDKNKGKPDSAKKQRSTNLQDISQKLKKKYSTTFSQKSKEKTTELLKARDKLTKKRHTKKLKKLSKSDVKDESESDASADDLPLSSIKAGTETQAPPQCIIEKDELQDGLRILIFMDGLFHEGEIKAIHPPDVYGAILDNERRTRPHICSQEEILRDAIKDVKPSSVKHLKEGTRICAYWSQQFSCLYPGTISRASPDPHGDKSLVNVEFDDGDNGKIPLDHIRMIPQDFPIVEYDPHPLLLLTKRRRTLSTSESSEPRISCSNIPPSPKENKIKRGPGRPPKADRLISEESVGDEDVFTNGNANDAKLESDDDDKSNNSEKSLSKNQKNEQKVPPTPPRQLWKWSGSSTKRPGLKGKAKKEYYKCIVRGRETVMVGESAVFLSTGRPNLPYVGRIESLWESWGGQMTVKVKWFYHPEETKGGKRLQNMKGALFRSDHEDENDVQTISHKCEVLKYEEFRRRKALTPLDESSNVYYLAGSYQPTIGHIKFEPGVI